MLTILGYIFGVVIIFIILLLVLGLIWSIRDENKRKKAIEEELSSKSRQEIVKIVKRLRYELRDSDTKIKNLGTNLQKEKEAKERAVDDLEKIQAELEKSRTETDRLHQEKIVLEKNLEEADNIRKSLIEELSGSSRSLKIDFIEVEAWGSLLSHVKEVIDIAQKKTQLASLLKEEINELKLRVDEVKNQSHIAPVKSQESINAIRELNESIRQANDEIKCLSRRNTLLEKENKKLTESLDNVEKNFELLEIKTEEQNDLNEFEKTELIEKFEALQQYREKIILENKLLSERTKKLEEDAQGSLFRIGLQKLYIGIVEDVNQKMAEFNESYRQLLVELEDRLVDAIHQADRSAFEEQLRVDAGYNLPGGN